MTPDQITETYEVLAPMATDYANANLERAGQAQASYGPLAQAAMGDSQTAGIGNYTYNRLVRPAVDTMRDQLIVEGYSNSLNKQLSDTLNKARENYNRATRRRNNGGGGGGGGTDGITIEDELIDDPNNNGGYSGTGTDTVSTLPSTANKGEYNVGTATVNGQTRIVTKEKDGRFHIQGVASYRSGSQEWKDAQKKYNIKLNPYPGSNIWTTFGSAN